MRLLLVERYSIQRNIPKDYDIKLGGKVVGEVYYNMRGYVGYFNLVKHPQISFRLGECAISNYKKELSRINREYKLLLEKL